jgi:hypothetical protein
VSGLLSASQLNALSQLVKKGMTSSAIIYDRVMAQQVDGVSETWVARSTPVPCWFYTNPQNSLIVNLGIQGVPNLLRLFFELGTDIEAADRVEVGGTVYTVVDTTHENTIQAMLTVNVRSLE